MNRWLLIVFFLINTLVVSASHIVGGEFELKHISGNTYRLSLIWYFDVKNNPDRLPEVQEPIITVSIFRKWDNFLERSVVLGDPVKVAVSYTQLECAKGEIVTDKLIYTAIIELSPSRYNHPEGYYVSWERCCRNYTITNIFSEDPQISSQWAGQTFYMEFPPVVKNGETFINNSPRLFPPLNDFACPYIPYYVDFAGVDDDGDSLVYSLVTPLSTHLPDALPPTLARPYPEVTWRPGFGLNNIVNGLTNLKISDDGFLTVTPSTQGLYVFAVKCEEYRDGIKIGEIRRDFQMLVVETGGCPFPAPPAIEGKKLNDPIFGNNGKLTVSYPNTVPLEDRCFEVKVTDPSTNRDDENNTEKIKIKAIALNFKKDISEVLPGVTTATISNGTEATFQICFPDECPYTKDGPFQIGIVAMDDACSLPLTDTLYVTVTIEPPPNENPEFENENNLTEFVETLSEGEPPRSWPLRVTDPDGDAISFRLATAGGFTLADYGMTFTDPLTGTGSSPLDKVLTWDPKCDVYDFTEKTNFELFFIAEDNDRCQMSNADTTYFNLSITDFSQITPPVIDNSVVSNADTIKLSWNVYDEPIVFGVSGFDADNTTILLRGNGVGFNAATYGASFPRNTGVGTVASQFEWNPDCKAINLDEKDEFIFELMVVDSLNKCRFYKADTLTLIIQALPAIVRSDHEFIPPNIFTPNDDGKNDFFAMVKETSPGVYESILPADNCLGEFVSISIYNRWGKQVYQSVSRDFKWYGEGMPPGIYYYNITYTDTNYKGTLTLRF